MIRMQIQAALSRAKRVLVATHVAPDGDAIGSAVATAHIAGHLGCDTRLLLWEALPDFLSWLPLPCPVCIGLTSLGEWAPDLLLVTDCSDIDRTGLELATFFRRDKARPKGWEKTVSVSIDHHEGNSNFADINWVEPWRAATGEMVGLFAEHLALTLEGTLGEAVYLALVSDTGHFSFANTGPESLALAARIVRAGLSVAKFTEKSENNWSLARMHLWGRLLNEVTLHANGAVACSFVTLSHLQETGAKKADLDGFASWLRKLARVRVGVVVREETSGFCKVSLRSTGDFDVRLVAALYGGGGHVSASGAEIPLALQEAAKEVLARVTSRL